MIHGPLCELLEHTDLIVRQLSSVSRLCCDQKYIYLGEDVEVTKAPLVVPVAKRILVRFSSQVSFAGLIVEYLWTAAPGKHNDQSYGRLLRESYVKPRCDETSLRIARAISVKIVEFGFKHSASSSYTVGGFCQ